MKEETVDQIKEFTETLDRMHKGDVSLNNKFSEMRKVFVYSSMMRVGIFCAFLTLMFLQSIRQAIATAFNTTETIKLFSDHSVGETESRLVALNQEMHLKKISAEQFEREKIQLLTKLLAEGQCLSEADRLFFETRQDRLLQQMEQIVDDEQE